MDSTQSKFSITSKRSRSIRRTSSRHRVGNCSLSTVSKVRLLEFRELWNRAAPSGPELKREIIETFETDLVESFGQTEALSTRLPPDRTIDKAESVGRPALNLEMKVVDSDGSRVPRGEIGRAGYKGPSVFAGYHGMPEKTAEVFDEDGWFISDDLIRRDEEGSCTSSAVRTI